ncbi:MAG: hypothetical protein ACLUTU_09670 [Blautia faecis]
MFRDRKKAIEATEGSAGEKRRRVGKDVAVIGGGLAGCEIAYDLVCWKGKLTEVIVEMARPRYFKRPKGLCMAETSVV